MQSPFGLQHAPGTISPTSSVNDPVAAVVPPAIRTTYSVPAASVTMLRACAVFDPSHAGDAVLLHDPATWFAMLAGHPVCTLTRESHACAEPQSEN